MNRVPLELILLCQDLLIPIIDVFSVLFKQIVNPNVEVLMSLYGLSVMEDIFGQVAVLDVHVLEPVGVLFAEQLVEENLLKIDPLDVQEGDHAIKVSLEAQVVVSIPPKVVNIDFLFDHDLWIAHLGNEVQSNIFEAEEACQVHWVSSLLIPLHKQLQDVVLALDQLIVVGGIIFAALAIESLHNCGQISLVSVHKDTFGTGKGLSLQFYHFVNLLLIALIFTLIHFEFFKFNNI
jgi:hypothetical protein